MNSKELSITDEGYFGLSLLDMGSYGANLLTHSWLETSDNPRFKETSSYYDEDEKALTVEGILVNDTVCSAAMNSLVTMAKLARQHDKLAQPFSSLDKLA